MGRRFELVQSELVGWLSLVEEKVGRIALQVALTWARVEKIEILRKVIEACGSGSRWS